MGEPAQRCCYCLKNEPPGQTRRRPFPFSLPMRVAQRHERVPEHVIRHQLTLGDAASLVERPMDAEINAALPVLFLSLGERGEAARDERARVSLIISRTPI